MEALLSSILGQAPKRLPENESSFYTQTDSWADSKGFCVWAFLIAIQDQ